MALWYFPSKHDSMYKGFELLEAIIIKNFMTKKSNKNENFIVKNENFNVKKEKIIVKNENSKENKIVKNEKKKSKEKKIVNNEKEKKIVKNEKNIDKNENEKIIVKNENNIVKNEIENNLVKNEKTNVKFLNENKNVKKDKKIDYITFDIYSNLSNRLDKRLYPDIKLKHIRPLLNFKENGKTREEAQQALNNLYVHKTYTENVKKFKFILNDCNSIIDRLEKSGFTDFFKVYPNFRNMFFELYVKLLGLKMGMSKIKFLDHLMSVVRESPKYRVSNDNKIYTHLNALLYKFIELSFNLRLRDNSSFFTDDKHVFEVKEDVREKFKFSTELIGKKLPRLVPDMDLDINTLLRTSHKNMGKTFVVDDTINTVKFLRGIKYRINNRVLEYLILNKKDWMGHKIIPFEKLEGYSIRAAYKFIMIDYQKFIDKNTTLELASVLNILDYFYYSIFIDWRGRIYSVGDYINYQGNKLGLSLLEFAEGKPLGYEGFDYIKLYGANIYGIKGSSKHLLEWISHNHNNIIDMNKDFMLQANDYELFVAFCLEYQNICKFKNPSKYISHFPVLVDCTCNGLQHLAAMVADAELGKHVNLTPNMDFTDIYKIMAIKCSDLLNNEHNIDIDRSMIKKVIMTIPYNASHRTIASYLCNAFDFNVKDGLYYERNKNFTGNGVDYMFIYKLGTLIHKHFYKMHPRIKDLSDYFKSWANLLSKMQLPIAWETPAGTYIIQQYNVVNKKSVKLSKYRSSITIKIPTDKISSLRQRNGLMPNIIHSLDATNIVNVIKCLSSDNCLLTIHDCFGSHACDIPLIQKAVKDGFVKIYCKKDFLDHFHTKCLNAIKDTDILLDSNDSLCIGNIWYDIPKKPELGTLKIENIINCEYMVK